MIRKIILLFIFSVLTFVNSQGQFLDKYTHTSQFTETRFMEIMNDEVYYVRLDYDSEFTEAETWLVRADRQLETIHEISLNQQLGLPDSVSVYVSDMKVYQSSYVHLTYTTTDWRNSNGLTQSGFLNYTADLTNVSDYSIALNDTNGVVILGSLDHNSALYVYGSGTYHGQSCAVIAPPGNLADRSSRFYFPNILPSGFSAFFDAKSLGTSGAMMLTTDQAFILADVSTSSASVISQGYHTFWGPVTTWQYFLVQELIRRDNNELPLAVGTGRYWDMQQTPPYPDEYSVFISESDTVNNKGFADTLSLGTLLPPTSSVHTLPRDMADDSDADSVIMIFVNTTATTLSYAYLTDSASLSIINYNANQNTTNWVKTYSTGNNLSPYAVVNRFTNGDVLIGINEHVVDTFGFQSSAIHWLLLDSDVSISTPEFHTTNHSSFIFPNPASDVLHIHGLVASESYSYSILDVSGRVVSNGILIDDSVDLNSLNLTAGMYFITLESETSGSVQTFEFVID